MLKINPAQVVPLFGKINYESIGKTLERIMSLLHSKPEEEVFLIINSGGGSLDAGFMFVDLVQASGVRLVTDFFFHEVGHSSEKDQRMSLSEIKDRGTNLTISQMWSADFIAKQTGYRLTKQKVLDFMKAETWMFPDDIVKNGLAHEII